MSPLVSINLLTFDGEKYIEDCLNSVFSQSYPNIEVLVIDNSSSDKTVETVEKVEKVKKFRLIKNKRNLGFAAGHNQGIKESKGEYILCLNQDVVLEKNFVMQVVEVLEKDKKIGAVQGKLLRQNDIIDTTGLLMLKNRRIVNRGQGEKDVGQYNKEEEVFGADGAAPIYRREALEDIKIPINISVNQFTPLDTKLSNGASQRKSASTKYEYFDEDFFCYKEDVDLAWRLKLSGWKTIYTPQSLAWHPRGSGDSAAYNFLDIVKERRKINSLAKYFSFKNQRLMQVKNEDLFLVLKYFPHILFKEIASWVYVIIFEKYGAKAIWQLLKQSPVVFKKRRIIMKNRRAGAKEIEKWFR